MPVTMDIREDGHVIYYKVEDPWTVFDFTRHFPEDEAHRGSAGFPVHVLVDMSKARQIPPGVFHLRKKALASHPGTGVTMIIGAGAYAQRIAEIVFRLAHNEKTRFVESEAQAWAYVKRAIASETTLR